MEGSAPETTELSITYGDITSPSQLQEVTLDQDVTFSNSMGLRSPGPMRGRSVKEYEEQLANLKKENFNLKLRIYFLEERMGTNFNLDKENVVKRNVELMVEVESLRKEVQEKHDLLCQAVKAMELEDEEHKKLMNDKDQEIEILKQQLQDDSGGDTSSKIYHTGSGEFLPCPEISTTFIKELQDKVQSLEEELNQEKSNSAAIQLLMEQNATKLTNLTQQLDEMNKKLSLRDEELRDTQFQLDEATGKYQGLYKKLQQKTQIIDEIKSENEQLCKRYELMVNDLEKEHKRYDKLKIASEQKIGELQIRLEASLMELKRSQELVVSNKNMDGEIGGNNTDADSFSVQKSTTSSRSPQKDTNIFPTSPIMTPTPSPSPSSYHFDHHNNTDLKCVFEKFKSELDHKDQKIVKLKAEQMKACKIIKSMIDSRNKANDEIATLKQKIELLEQELEGVVSQQKAGENLDNSSATRNLFNEKSLGEETVELVEHYKILTDELEEKNRILVATLSEKDNQLRHVQNELEEIAKLHKEKEDKIVDLEFEMLSTNGARQLKAKDEEIHQLREQLTQRNHDLQGLVNKELWEKNREIEKLQKKQEKCVDTVQLQNDLKMKESQLCLIKSRISELGIEIDMQSGDLVTNNDNHLQNELEKSEKLRLEANEVCGVLSRRLEELAIFLDSLLKQKSILGFLGNRENKRLREIIDQSLDLSRSFTVSMLINPEHSLMQLTNISGLLNDDSSLGAANLSLTYKSHLYSKNNEDEDSSQIIEALRGQIVNLKYELQLRDVELNKMNGGGTCTEPSSEKEEDLVEKNALNTTSTTLKYKSDDQSESEAWSEPDRFVSRARIGLLEGGSSFRSNTTSKKITSCTSTDSTEEEGGDKSFRSSNNSRRGTILNESRSTIIELHNQVCELEGRLQAAEIQKEEAEQLAEQLQNEKDELIEKLTVKDKELQNEINRLEREKDEVLSVAKEAEEAANIAKNDIKLAEVKLRSMQQEIVNLQDQSLKQMKEMQNAAEAEINSLRHTIEELHIDYNENYVKRCEVESALDEIDRLRSEIEGLEERIEELTCNEYEVKIKLGDYEEKINTLRGDLDNATLQYSEAVLEKTKMASEKALIEQELNRTVLREVDLKKRLDEVDAELVAVRQNYQKKISSLQMEKSKLEVRISQLESSNAELHNRLIKIQAGCGDHLSTSLPNPPNFVNQIVSFRRQHSDNSGYVSDQLMEEMRVVNTSRFNNSRLMANANIDIERNEANSSPDLGIESDHGRFSSLETHLNVPRPLLQTLELTESMNNLLDGDNNQVETIACDNVRCCQKTMEMANENTDLKRKLLRTRRALEETVTQLTLANQRKKQVEKTICKQIHKTSQVLRKAKANLDSGSETDVFKQ